MKNRIANFLLVPLSFVVLSACWDKTDTGDDLLDNGVKVVASVGTQMHAREVIIETLSVADRPGSAKDNIQITVDGAVISVVSSSPQATPTIRGDDIAYAGHVVSVTATPNSFLLDGAPLNLPPNSRFSIVDGRPSGIF